MKKLMLSLVLMLVGGLIAPAIQGMEPQPKDISSWVELKKVFDVHEDSWFIHAYDINTKEELGFIEYEDFGEYWSIERFGVRKQHQKKGIGTLLFCEACKDIQRYNPREIHWDAEPFRAFSNEGVSTALSQNVSIYRRLCVKIQSFLPGTLEEKSASPESDGACSSVKMTYRLFNKKARKEA